MSKAMSEKNDRRDTGRYNWILELGVFAIVTPALIYGVLSLSNIPLV